MTSNVWIISHCDEVARVETQGNNEAGRSWEVFCAAEIWDESVMKVYEMGNNRSIKTSGSIQYDVRITTKLWEVDN